jgi:metal-responsive CopG/Arc/MetJ family transcriptional regulator
MRRVTITLPDDILVRVDNERNDVTRSRYVLRLLEKAFQLKKSAGESK